jgi:hypothetical protein
VKLGLAQETVLNHRLTASVPPDRSRLRGQSGSPVSARIYEKAPLRRGLEPLRGRDAAISAGRHRHQPGPRNHLRYSPVLAKIPQPDRASGVFPCGGLEWRADRPIRGIAEEPTGSELKRAQEIYFAAWPDGPARMAWPGIAYFVVRPRWIRYSDFDQRPALVEEMVFDQK